ncbi:MAG: ribosome biogenesis GTPase Der [bacterium]
MPTVVIVGRKNVGKSTIFNRLTGMRLSIVHKDPGVTRDRVYTEVEWCGQSFGLVDTGGFFPDEEFLLARSIQKQIEVALQEADLVYFVVDGRTGPKPADQEISEELRKTSKRIFLIVNKIDDQRFEHHASEFYELGYDDVFLVSAEAGKGFGDVLDATLKALPASKPTKDSTLIKLLILGRPNSGKSTLLNAILKEERAIVDAQPGTTRDLINARFSHKGSELEIIDTAGIRKRARIKNPIEFYSVMRAINMIDRTDITILIFDTTTGTVLQDQHLASLVLAKAKGLIIAPNKIDMIERKNHQRIIASTAQSLPFLEFVPVVPISAKAHTNIETLMQKVLEIYRESGKIVCKRVLEDMSKTLKPPPRGEIIKLKQIGQRPPVFHATLTTTVKESYIRYLRNTIRHYFGFAGTPILIKTNTRIRRRKR